jgi:hypothetical protein
MANHYATERWLRARLREHDAALRAAGSLITDMLAGTAYTTRHLEHVKGLIDNSLERASARPNSV